MRDNRGIYQLEGTSRLTVNIVRDLQDPRFTNLPNSVALQLNTAPESVIYTVNARDDDLRVRLR